MRTFKEVVKSIKRSEKDVDKVLRAAKLTRNPIDNLYEHFRYESMLEAVVAISFMVIVAITIIAVWH